MWPRGLCTAHCDPPSPPPVTDPFHSGQEPVCVTQRTRHLVFAKAFWAGVSPSAPQPALGCSEPGVLRPSAQPCSGTPDDKREHPGQPELHLRRPVPARTPRGSVGPRFTSSEHPPKQHHHGLPAHVALRPPPLGGRSRLPVTQLPGCRPRVRASPRSPAGRRAQGTHRPRGVHVCPPTPGLPSAVQCVLICNEMGGVLGVLSPAGGPSRPSRERAEALTPNGSFGFCRWASTGRGPHRPCSPGTSTRAWIQGSKCPWLSPLVLRPGAARCGPGLGCTPQGAGIRAP